MSSNHGSVSNMMNSTMSGKMVSTGSNNGRLVSGCDSAVGVGNQVGDVQGTSITMVGHSNRSSMGDGRHSRDSCMGNSGNSVSHAVVGCCDNTAMSVLSCQMVGLQGGDAWLIERGDGTVGMTLQAEEALRSSQGLAHTGSENQKLHDYCARV